MEKLQAALHKARQKRDKSPQITRTRRTPRAGGTGDVVHLWESLPPMSVSETQLIKHRIVSHEAGAQATPFDIMRTKILLQMQQNGWTRLAITSPMQNCGKTTTACNLAMGLGRQHNVSAILMDLDLQSPSIHTFFNQRPRHNVADVLNGEVEFGEQAMRIGENVAVSMSSAPETDPTRILLAEETEKVLDTIQSTYAPDMVIFDLPSVLVSDNTRAFLKNVDCALVVARAGATRYGQFDTCEREIAEYTNVLGVVLNACRAGATQNDLE